jgi:hypothetical protein
LTDKAPLNPRRYVMRHITSRPARSGLIVAGVAIAVAFFVLFAAMSAGLSDFIDEELDRPRTTHIFLDSGSPTPFSPDQVGLVELVASRSQEETGVPHHVTPRVRLPVSATEHDAPLTAWGVDVREDGIASPPYDTSARLAAGRHLRPEDGGNTTNFLYAVLGGRYAEAVLPASDRTLEEAVHIELRPGDDVDPWWMPDAQDYPLEGRTSFTSEPQGPIGCLVVGILEPGQGEDLDWGAFIPLNPLLIRLDQNDPARDKHFYPQVVITIEDASRVDVRDLEETLVETVPGVQGTDDHWDPEAFKASYGGALAALDGWLVIITAVLVVMLVAGVSDTTLVAVTDRRREIATLRAVGIPGRKVSRLVLTEVALLVGAGLALGLVIGSAVALLFGGLHETTGGSGVFLAPTSLDAMVLAAAALLALGSAVLAAAYPAHRAGGQRPTEALRYE